MCMYMFIYTCIGMHEGKVNSKCENANFEASALWGRLSVFQSSCLAAPLKKSPPFHGKNRGKNKKKIGKKFCGRQWPFG